MSWLKNLTDWNEAAKHPWQVRAFNLVFYFALTLFLAWVAGSRGPSVGIAAVVVAVTATLLLEPALGRGASPRYRSRRAVAVRSAVVAAIYLGGIAVGLAVGSALAAGVLVLLGVVALVARQLAWTATEMCRR